MLFRSLSNPAHVQHLPASWGTLYELTKLSDVEFNDALEQNIICPDMIRADAEQIRPLVHRAPILVNPKRATGEPPEPTPQIQQTDFEQGARSNGGSPVAPMPSGGLAIAHRREEGDGRDFFPTPPWATRALLEHVFPHLHRRNVPKFTTAWEPACGEGHMAEVLKEYFKQVYASDKFDYPAYPATECDFITEGKDIGADWIITNPPFNTSTEFVLRALELAHHGVAMFVRLSWLESIGRYERIFKPCPPTQLAIFCERVPLHKGRWENDGVTMTAYAWLVWTKNDEPRAPFWIPPGCREALTKPDDVKRFGKIVEAA